jgi:tetratricopeptide (TPR) repeat protein
VGKARRQKVQQKALSSRPRVPVVANASAREIVIYAIAIALVTAVAYGSVRRNGFVYYDDPKYVAENYVVLRGLTMDGIRWAFTTGTDANWFPVTWLSHMLDVELFGSNAGAHHLVSLIIHIASAVLLLLALTWMTNATGRSAFAAALFALHPLHVESVAWVAERKDVLSTFFFMLTLCAYARYARKPGTVPYSFVAAFFAIGLMCKPMLVTLPFVLLLLDFWPLKRLERASIGKLAKEKLPLFALCIVSSVVTFMVQRRGGAVAGLDSYPFVARVGNAFTAYAEYIRMMLWPAGLASFYPYPESVSPSLIATAIAIVGACTFAAIRNARTYPYILVGWLWYLGTLVPVIGLVQVGNQALADRYTYVPLTGLFIIAGWGAFDVARKWRLPKLALPAGALVVLAAFAVIAHRQVSFWRDSVSLWTHALAVTSENYLAHNNLGRELAENGKVDEAIGHYNAALKIRPAYATARVNLGVALSKSNRTEEAIASYDEALRLKPDLPEAHVNLGAALVSQGKLSEAIEHYRVAIALNPNLPQARANLGLALASTGRVDDAIVEYKNALQLKPDFVEVHNNLGFALASQEKLDEAIPHLKEALALNPNFVLARVNLAMTLANAGRKAEALREFREVLRIEPGHQLAKDAVERLQAH